MRPVQLILLVLCFVFLPILLTTFSLRSAHSQGSAATRGSGSKTSRLQALFSFHAPSSLFPPSAIISLTDDNSTFFLARPAAFGSILPSTGLSGQLWIGNGFVEDAVRKGGVTTWSEGELGCSDVPGWVEGDNYQASDYGSRPGTERLENYKVQTKPGGEDSSLNINQKRDIDTQMGYRDGRDSIPTENDGTDDHLYNPPQQSSDTGSSQLNENGNNNRLVDKSKPPEHADIQSLQESAEISGKVVLLSRGGCGFLEKVEWAQRRGGIAVIVGDNTRGGGLVTMYAHGDTSNVTIPAVFTSHTTAHLLSSLIPPENLQENRPSSGISRMTKDKGKLGKKATVNGAPSATAMALPKPTTSSRSKSNPSSASNTGLFNSILSFLSISKGNAYTWTVQEDSRRPPSSGNLDWESEGRKGVDNAPLGLSKNAQSSSRQERDGIYPRAQAKSDARQGPEDDFVIGVQDWRDPDLLDVKSNTVTPYSSSAMPRPTGVNGWDNDEKARKPDSASPSNNVKGGKSPPRSGEYVSQDKSFKVKGNPNNSGHQSSVSSKLEADESDKKNHWWSGPFGTREGNDDDKSPFSVDNGKEFKGESSDGNGNTIATQENYIGEEMDSLEHEGLWVTLTPTSMSTSPFFDTLLVLVVSPLITLTVVYALLLVRSRIRRRRWRAPKAVVDRLPVRTYHTIPSSSGSNSSTPPQTATPRTTPGTPSPSSPLLSHLQPRSPRTRPRMQNPTTPVATSSDPLDPAADRSSYGTEKSISGSTLWRRKYTGRQVECVVCLEEYIDGQSRVMSLPCGHEFHAECITPWLTTRRRTCPICKGDVVRSLGHNRGSSAGDSRSPPATSEDIQTRIAQTRNDSPSSAMPIPDSSGDVDSDLERGANPNIPLLGSSSDTSTQTSWRNLASLSLSALGGDSMWHQTRHTGSNRNR